MGYFALELRSYAGPSEFINPFWSGIQLLLWYMAVNLFDVQYISNIARMRSSVGVTHSDIIACRGRLQGKYGKDRNRMDGNNIKNISEKTGERQSSCCHQKSTPRGQEELKLLKNRLNRITGQLNGIGKMLDENRYCGDILVQVAAVESALQSLAYRILQEHMESCVVEEIAKGNLDVIGETVELVKKLK